MKLKTTLLIIGAVMTTLVISSCGPKQVENKDEQVTKDTLKDAVISNVTQIRANIPSPTDISKNFNKAGYAYMKNLLNPSSKAGSYSTKSQAAFGMGAYGADMGYIGSYNQNGDAADYLAQIAKLAQQLKIETAFDPAFIQKMSTAKGDSITVMLNVAFQKAERNLRSNDRMSVAAMVITGGWIEGLHIAIEAIGSKPTDEKNQDLYHDIYVHVYAFQNVLDLLRQYDKDPDCIKLLEEIKPFEKTLTDYGNKPKLNDQNLGPLKDAVNGLRNKLL
jgi:hypothetical protein